MNCSEKDECYLCGTPATTRDHIPPKGIFPEPRPNDMITVPACRDCNGKMALDDEYFRLMVAAGSNDSPQSRNILHQRIIPRMRKNPALIVDFMESVHGVSVHTPAGIYLGKAPVFNYDRQRIQVVIDKIVRGLFLKHAKRRLPTDCTVEDFYYMPMLDSSSREVIGQLPPFAVGDGTVFSYRYHLSNEVEFESCWFLMFYNDTSLFVTQTSHAPIPSDISSSARSNEPG